MLPQRPLTPQTQPQKLRQKRRATLAQQTRVPAMLVPAIPAAVTLVVAVMEEAGAANKP